MRALRPVVLASAFCLGCDGPAGTAQPTPTSDVPAQGVRLTPKARLGEVHALVRKGETRDPLGHAHVHYARTYRGVTVWGEEEVAHLDGQGVETGRTSGASSELDTLEVDVEPSLSLQDAQEIGLGALGLESSDPTADGITTTLVVLPHRTSELRDTGGRAPNAQDVRTKVDGARLVFHVRAPIDARSPSPWSDAFVDAHSGEVVRVWSRARNDLEPETGTGRTQYYGTVTLDVAYNTDKHMHELNDPVRNIGTVNENYWGNDNGNFTSSGDDFGGYLGPFYVSDPVWGDYKNFDAVTGSGWEPLKPSYGKDTRPSKPTPSEVPGGLEWTPIATNTANGQTAGADVHFGVMTTWDFFREVFRRDGYDGAHGASVSHVHVGFAWYNASWSELGVLWFGDAYPPIKNMVSLETVAHEYMHAVTGSIVGGDGFNYDCDDQTGICYGEPGGIDEATSDFFSLMTESWFYGESKGHGDTIPDKGVAWTIGEEEAGAPDRIAYKPSLLPKGIDYWFPGLDKVEVHDAAGPLERCLYFLSQGADPLTEATPYTSVFLPHGMEGVGNDAAARIWFLALHYLLPTSGYWDARDAAIRAVGDLYGAGTPEEQAVWNAFAAINVGDTWDAAHHLVEAELNDSALKANDVPYNHSTVVGWIDTGLLVDEDWFKFHVWGPAKLTVTLTSPAKHDYDLYVYNAAGKLVASSTMADAQDMLVLPTSGLLQQFQLQVIAKDPIDSSSDENDSYMLAFDY